MRLGVRNGVNLCAASNKLGKDWRSWRPRLRPVGLESGNLDGDPLLLSVMKDGQRVDSLGSLENSRERASHELLRLPPHLRSLERTSDYEVAISASLRELAASLNAATTRPVI